MDGKVIHIDVKGMSKSFADGDNTVEVLKDVNLSVHSGEFLTLFGPNGCGKTTLVNVIAGIESCDNGSVRFANDQESIEIGYVFQNYRDSLMPWLNVERNVCFPLKLRGYSRKQQKERLEDLLNRFNVKLDLKSKIYNLSGGQAQLVSILRGLITNPSILILDEPFSALDYQTNLTLYSEILKIWSKANITVLFISHEIDEAIYLGDRVVFLSSRPATVVDILECSLPRPRNLEMMGSVEFARIKKAALDIFQSVVSLKPN